MILIKTLVSSNPCTYSKHFYAGLMSSRCLLGRRIYDSQLISLLDFDHIGSAIIPRNQTAPDLSDWSEVIQNGMHCTQMPQKLRRSKTRSCFVSHFFSHFFMSFFF